VKPLPGAPPSATILSQDKPRLVYTHLTKEYAIRLMASDKLSQSPELWRGVCKWWATEKGYGFLTVPGRAEDVFCHFSGIAGSGRRDLIKGQTVEFNMEESKVKPGHVVAVNVIVIE